MATNFVSPTNKPLTDPLDPKLLWLNLDGSTPTYIYIYIPLMEEIICSLPYTSIVSSTMSSLPPLSVERPTHLSSWGIPPVPFMDPTNLPNVSMPSPSSMPTIVVNPSQLVGSGIFTLRFSQPTIIIAHMGMVTSRNVWGGSSVAPSHPRGNFSSNISQD